MSPRAPLLGRTLLLTASAGACVGACSAAGGVAQETHVPATHRRAPPGTGGVMPPPGDAEQAVRAQFAEAEQRGDVAAYRLFIERHPDHPLAREAERRIALLEHRAPR